MKNKLALFEYGAIVAFVAVIVFATTQVVDANAFAAFNAPSDAALNAVVDAPAVRP